MSIPQIEQAKIQARIAVPIIKAFQAELGEDRANEIVRTALDAVARRTGEAASAFLEGNPVEKVIAGLPIPAAGNARDVEVITQTSDAFQFDVTGCRYGESFKELG